MIAMIPRPAAPKIIAKVVAIQKRFRFWFLLSSGIFDSARAIVVLTKAESSSLKWAAAVMELLFSGIVDPHLSIT